MVCLLYLVIGMFYQMSTNKSYMSMQITYMNGRILPSGDFKKLPFPNTEGQQSCKYPLDQIVDLLQISEDNEYEFFIEYDLEYPAEIKQTIENFPLCPYQVEANCELFSEYMNLIKPPNYKPTQKLLCDLAKKNKNI